MSTSSKSKSRGHSRRKSFVKPSPRELSDLIKGLVVQVNGNEHHFKLLTDMCRAVGMDGQDIVLTSVFISRLLVKAPETSRTALLFAGCYCVQISLYDEPLGAKTWLSLWPGREKWSEFVDLMLDHVARINYNLSVTDEEYSAQYKALLSPPPTPPLPRRRSSAGSVSVVPKAR